MEIQVLKHEKDNLELQLDNVTVAEILRVYLNENGVDFAAWKREHPTKPVLMNIQSKGKTVNKEVSEAVAMIKKDLESLIKLVKR